MSTQSEKQASGPIGWKPPDFRGKVAVVTGASRGAGRGIALALGDTGATVYVAGRTVRGGPKPPDGAPGTIHDTADEITARGGRGIAVRTDCTVEEEVTALFARVAREQRRLDILANGVWGSNEQFTDKGWRTRPFWESPRNTGWQDAMMGGAYAALLASRYAARQMARQRRGLIVHVTEPIFEKHDKGGPLFWMFYMLGHRAINRMVEAMSPDLKKRKVTIIALAPGFMRTERVMMSMKLAKDRKRWRFDLSETTEYAGRAVASLAADARALRHAGKLLFVGDLAREYGFKDADGKAVANIYRKLKMI